jgi:hypothetical protein
MGFSQAMLSEAKPRVKTVARASLAGLSSFSTHLAEEGHCVPDGDSAVLTSRGT